MIVDEYYYGYDNAGNQTSKEEIIAGVQYGTTTYMYDVLNRLETVIEPVNTVTAGMTITYTYDASGNRLTETTTDNTGSTPVVTKDTYTYNGQNRLTQVTTTVNNITTEVTKYGYDNNGNVTTTEKTEYTDGNPGTPVITIASTYDVFNQQISSTTEEGSVVTNTYNAEGYRVAKAVDGNITRFVYVADNIILELDGSGEETARNVYGLNLLKRVAKDPTDPQADASAFYYMYNGHADVTALIDLTSKETVATYYYDAFGNILNQTGDVNNNITYAGYEYDEETDTYYLNARMYDPKIARFLQEDTYRGTSSDPLSLNLYAYCANNPLIYWDPTGHVAEDMAELIEDNQNYLKEILAAKEDYEDADEYDKEQWYGFARKLFRSKGEKNAIARADSARNSIVEGSLYKNDDTYKKLIDIYLIGDHGGTSNDINYIIGYLTYQTKINNGEEDRNPYTISGYRPDYLRGESGDDAFFTQGTLDSLTFGLSKIVIDQLDEFLPSGCATSEEIEYMEYILFDGEKGFLDISPYDGGMFVGEVIKIGCVVIASGGTAAPAIAVAGGGGLVAATPVGVTEGYMVLEGIYYASKNDNSSERNDSKEGASETERKFNVSKQESDVYNGFDNVKGQDRRTSGTGSNKRYYEWDHTHNDIEVYNKKGKHLGSMDPVTGEMYKGPVKGRTIDL